MFNEEEMQRQALGNAISLARGVTVLVRAVNEHNKSYSKKFHISRQQLNNCRNRKDKRPPYDRLVDIASVAGVSINGLAPDNPTNSRLIWPKKFFSLKTPAANILVNNPRYLREIEEGRPVIIDTTGMIITDLARVEAYKAVNLKYIPVEVIDLEAVLLEIQKTELEHLQSIRNVDLFLPLELIYMGFHLKQLIGDRQGQCNDVSALLQKNNIKNDKNEQALRRDLYEIKPMVGTTGEYLVEALGFSSKDTYYPVERICLNGIKTLIAAFNQEVISIDRAFKLSKLSKDKQSEALNRILNGSLKKDPIKNSCNKRSR
jgi:hypothetical protein